MSSGNNAGQAIVSCSNYGGPIFGAGHDIFIANNAAYSSSSYSSFYTYSPPNGYNSSGSSSFLAGSYSFTPDEIETFFYEPFIPEGEIILSFTYLLIDLLFALDF